MLPALLGTSKTGRTVLVEQAGARLALRQGRWKYIPPSQGPRIQQNTNTELGNDPEPQLYDLATDPGERNNLAAAQPEKVRELAALLEEIRRAAAASPRAPEAPEHRPRHRRRLVVSSREHLRRSDGQHAELRSRRARGRAVHARVRRVAVVHAVTRGAPDRPGRPPARGRRQPARVSSEDLRGVSRSAWKTPATSSDSPARGGGPAASRRAGARGIPPGRSSRTSTTSWSGARKGVRSLLVRQPAIRTGRTSPGTGAQSGLKADRVRCRGFCPDTPDVRNDLLDYYFEVQRFDRDLGAHHRGARTRGGAREHDRHRDVGQRHAVPARQGERLRRRRARAARDPLARRRAAGAVIDAFVSLTDLAPTLLEGAGLTPLDGDDRPHAAAAAARRVAGRTRSRVHRAGAPRERPARRFQLPGQRHPDEGLSLHPELPSRPLARGRPAAVRCGGAVRRHRRRPVEIAAARRQTDPAIAPFFQLATAKRPAEELYDLRRDPDQLKNVAGQPAHRAAQQRLREELDRWLRETGDPRATADDDRWDRFPYYGAPAQSPRAGG